MNNISDLNLRYAKGLGDIIACILHSKIFGWLTHLITGKKEPCKVCSIRRNALNVIFPIPVWRLFFKNENELTQSLASDLKKNNYEVNVETKNGSISSIKSIVKHEEKPEIKKDLNTYMPVSSNETKSGDLLIRVQVFKKII